MAPKPLDAISLLALRKQIGPQRRPRRSYPPITKENQPRQRTSLSSRRATWVVLRKPEDRSAEDQRLLTLLEQTHPQVQVACTLAQAFVKMIRSRNASAFQPWLEEAARSDIPELRTFAAGIKRDQAAILAALTYERSQGQVEGQVHRLKLLKRQSYGQAGFDLLRHRVLARSA
ncbi:MAG TPA: transposase [Ktedonobacteraceae bacterium]|nr:transposase [Ktedonobacteraceae bacterium]